MTAAELPPVAVLVGHAGDRRPARPATVRIAVGDAVQVVAVPGVDHDRLVLSARGARTVAREILSDRCREHSR